MRKESANTCLRAALHPPAPTRHLWHEHAQHPGDECGWLLGRHDIHRGWLLLHLPHDHALHTEEAHPVKQWPRTMSFPEAAKALMGEVFQGLACWLVGGVLRASCEPCLHNSGMTIVLTRRPRVSCAYSHTCCGCRLWQQQHQAPQQAVASSTAWG